MFHRVFQKVGKVAFNTSQNYTIKQNLIKNSINTLPNCFKTTTLTSSFSTQSLACQQMQSLSLLTRTTPLLNGVALTIQNLRQMLQKCKQQSEIQSSSSTMGQYLVSVGIIDSNVLCMVDSCKTLWLPRCNQISETKIKSYMNE